MFRITMVSLLAVTTAINAQRNCPNGQCAIPASDTQGKVIYNTDPVYIHPVTGDIYDRMPNGIYKKRAVNRPKIVAPKKDSGVLLTPAIGQIEQIGQVEQTGDKAGSFPTGVDWDKIRKDKDTYSINGKEVEKKKVTDLIEGNSVRDDSNKKRITVVGGTPEMRTAALDAIGKPEWAVVQAYPSDHWYVKQYGFVSTGEPTTYIQSPNGKVEHRQDNLVGLKDIVASYDPKKDPDKRESSGNGMLIVWGLLAFAAYRVISK